MTAFWPTHIVSIEDTDLDGVVTVAAAGVPAAVARRGQGGGGTPGYRVDESAITVTIRLPNGTPCKQGNQIIDAATSRRWLVDTADTNHNPAIAADVVATCRDLDGGA